MLRSRLGSPVILAFLSLMTCLPALGQYDPVQILNAWQTRQPGLTLVGSHRGEINGAYGNNMPENSLNALQNAVDAGNEIVEMDIYTTQEHVPYLMHDKTLYRMMGLNQPSAFSSDPHNPAAQWSAIKNFHLCGSRGITDVSAGGTGQCESNYSPIEYVPSLVQLANAVRTAQNLQGQTWGGIIILDIRDVDGFVQSWSTLMQLGQLGFLAQQVVFKCSPLNLNLFSPQDIANMLATGPYYANSNATQAAADMQSYLNLQPYYVGNRVLAKEQSTGNSNWAIDDWNSWVSNVGSFHRLISAEVDVKGQPGELLTADPLLGTVQSGLLNTVGVYSTYFDCNLSTGPQNLPNLPPGAAGLNGYWTTGGKCVTLVPLEAESADLIDHRYDYNFITGITSPNTPMITDPPAFGMILADTSGVLVNYLNGIGQRTALSAIKPHCNSGSAYPGCDANGETTYTLCALEGGTCNFAGDRNITFGANGTYSAPQTFSNVVACNTKTFGDPLYGVSKACYSSPALDASSYPTVYCADETQPCTANLPSGGTQDISAHGNYFSLYTNTGFTCNTKNYSSIVSSGDPAPGYVKACFLKINQNYFSPHTGPAGYAYCAPENGVCQFKGLGRIAYGASGTFPTRVLAGPVACNNVTFGDPKPGYTKDCWYESTAAASSVTGTGGGSGTAACDIYASGGTPCVAAHSTVRALFSGYSGRLYQVKRASDGSTSDIGTLATGGYANAASQDSFCAGTTCIITMIYDQSPLGNNLAIEGAGGTVTTPDSGAVANALPVTVSGHAVYGVKVTSGVGYRNNATSGIAKGASPEGIYMVTSGTFVNGGPSSINNGCCFDYGNAEVSGSDTGNGHMDALNITMFCGYPPCTGSGPWVQEDLENGQYMGNGNNPGDQSINSNFVTAMSENNGQNTFALYAGNAQSGTLTTEYSGSLPTVKSGYVPMSLEGAIVLGTGGDNSDWGIGSFFEGAMVSGYPSAATEAAVQANIVAAGYSGDSSGGSGGSGVSVPAGPYTGPSDPNGPGPQDGFLSTAIEQPNDLMQTKPAMAYFNGQLYVAFVSNDSRNQLEVSATTNGQPYPTAAGYPGILMGSAPAMTVFNHQLYLAFKSNDTSNRLCLTSSSTGSNFPTAACTSTVLVGSAPALAVFRHQLFAAFKSNDSFNRLCITSSQSGSNFPTAACTESILIGSAPAMAVFNSTLYVAFRANDASNRLFVATSSDGVNFTSQVIPGLTMSGNSSPALVVSNNVLYYIYGANDTDNEMLVAASTDGVNWQGPAAYTGVQMGATGPAATAFPGGITVGFQSNDSRNVLFTSSKATEAATYTGISDPNGPGPQDGFVSPAFNQPNDVMGSKPGMSFDESGNIYVAFSSNDARNQLEVASTTIGNAYPVAAGYSNNVMGSAPAVWGFGGQVFIAYQSADIFDRLCITSSPTGTNFPTADCTGTVLIGSAPALAAFTNGLYVAFQSDDPTHRLCITSSPTGTNFPTAACTNSVLIGSAPSMVAFKNKLYVGFRANDSSNNAFVASSSDGTNFTSQFLSQTMGGDSSPALATSLDGGSLYYIYGANDAANEMLVMTTTDGSNWSGPAVYAGVKMGATGPAATPFLNGSTGTEGITVGFLPNDSTNVLFTTNKNTN